MSKMMIMMTIIGFYNDNRTTGALPGRKSFLCRMVWNKDCAF